MHLRAKSIAAGGLMLAVTVILMALGSVIESSTLFLLAAASYFVGIIVREFGLRTGGGFYLAAVLLGLFSAPDKFYVCTFAAMGLYIWGTEAVWRFLDKHPQIKCRIRIFYLSKFLIFNALWFPVVLIFRNLLFGREISDLFLIGILAFGQAVLVIYDRAYDYVQGTVWNKLRKHFL